MVLNHSIVQALAAEPEIISKIISQAKDKIVSNQSERERIPQTNPQVAMSFF